MLVDITIPGQAPYAAVSRFARETYKKQLGAAIAAAPDVFAYAREKDTVVGSFGLYRVRPQTELPIETYIPNAFEKIARTDHVDRNTCGELGTRAVVPVPGFRSGDISLALAASLLIHAYANKVTCLAFTSNRTVQVLARTLGVELVVLGEPDLSRAGQVFRKNWETFFNVRQLCFGFKLGSVGKCFEILAHFEKQGIHSPVIRANPTC